MADDDGDDDGDDDDDTGDDYDNDFVGTHSLLPTGFGQV